MGSLAVKRVDAKWDYGEAKTAFFFQLLFHLSSLTDCNNLELANSAFKSNEDDGIIT